MSETKSLELVGDSASELLTKRIRAIELRGLKNQKEQLLRDYKYRLTDFAKKKFNLTSDDLNIMPAEEIEALEKALEIIRIALKNKMKKWLIIESLIVTAVSAVSYLAVGNWAIIIFIAGGIICFGPVNCIHFDENLHLSDLNELTQLKKQIKDIEQNGLTDITAEKEDRNDE